MMYFNENQIIELYLETFKEKCSDTFDSNVKIKKLRKNEPIIREFHKDYKDGHSSSEIEIDFNLVGWSGFSDNALDDLLKSTLEVDENFYPIVDMEIFQFTSKGKLNVKIIFKFVFTRVDVREEVINSTLATNTNETFIEKSKNITPGKQNINSTNSNNQIDNSTEERDKTIREIELRLSEIYTLLSKLK